MPRYISRSDFRLIRACSHRPYTWTACRSRMRVGKTPPDAPVHVEESLLDTSPENGRSAPALAEASPGGWETMFVKSQRLLSRKLASGR